MRPEESYTILMTDRHLQLRKKKVKKREEPEDDNDWTKWKGADKMDNFRF